jgi:type IV pilus assembly protein PilF
MQRLILVAGGLLLTVSLLGACSSKQARQDQENKTRVARTNTELGIGYLQQGERKLAIEKLQKAVEADPDYAPAQHSLALAYQEFGQLELAEKHYRAALKLQPGDGAINNNFGAYLCGQNRFDEADEHFRSALRDPTYRTPQAALENAGLCVLRKPDIDKAEQYLRQALKVDSALPGALLGMARVSFERNQTLNTRAWLQRYEAVGVLPPSGLLIGVQVERRLGDNEAALRYATQLNSRYPDSVEAQQLRNSETGTNQ